MKIRDRLNQQAAMLHERARDVAALEREHEQLRDGIRALAEKCEDRSMRGLPHTGPRNYGLKNVAEELRALLNED